MKKLIAITAACCTLFTSCRHVNGSGKIVTEQRNIGGFTALSVGHAFEVEVKNGAPGVTIEVDDNLLKYVDVQVNGHTLEIGLTKTLSISNGHFKAYVSGPGLTSIDAHGASDVTVIDAMKSSNEILYHSSGASTITATVDAPNVQAEASGAGNINLKGRTKDYTAKASGGSNIKSKELLSENAHAEATGAGNVHVYASVKLSAHASGAGNVYYSGGGRIESNTSGAGNVKKED